MQSFKSAAKNLLKKLIIQPCHHVLVKTWIISKFEKVIILLKKKKKEYVFLYIKANAELQYVWNISAQVQIAALKTVEGNDYTNFPQCFSHKL